MNMVMLLIGGLIFLSFPFIVLQKIKKAKQENTDEAKKKLNLFLNSSGLCIMGSNSGFKRYEIHSIRQISINNWRN